MCVCVRECLRVCMRVRVRMPVLVCVCVCVGLYMTVHQIVNTTIVFLMRYIIIVLLSFTNIFVHQVFNHARSNSFATINKYLTDVWYNGSTRIHHMMSCICPSRTSGVDLDSSPLVFLSPYTHGCTKTQYIMTCYNQHDIVISKLRVSDFDTDVSF